MLENILSEARSYLSQPSEPHDNETKCAQQQQQPEQTPQPNLLSFLDSSLDCLNDVNSTNHFMIMTINRCIEYTKASQGLKLVPVMETLDLREALELPLRIMREIQSRIRITMVDIPNDICSCVVSDKQWLQENVLCLLSNAVKYSHSGTVEVRISHEVAKDSNDIGYSEKSSNTVSISNAAVLFHSQDHRDALSEPPPQTDATAPSATNQHCLWKAVNCFSPGWKGCKSSRAVYADDPPAPPASAGVSRQNSAWSFQSQQSSDKIILRIEVEDQGIGMSQKAMRHLFSPFQQQQVLAIGSTGLGLFSLRKRIEALGGQCGVTGRKDGTQGSLFWFTIPYRPDHITANEMQQDQNASVSPVVPRASGQPNSGVRRSVDSVVTTFTDDDTSSHFARTSVSTQSPTFQSKRKHVLLVDDTPSIMKVTTNLLKRENFRVTSATNGAMALDIIRAEQERTGEVVVFDLVLMDLQMPIMDGIEAIRRLRQLELSQQKAFSVKVSNADNLTLLDVDKSDQSKKAHIALCLSADVNEGTVKLAEDAGFNGYLQKPIQMAILLETLQQMQQNNPV